MPKGRKRQPPAAKASGGGTRGGTTNAATAAGAFEFLALSPKHVPSPLQEMAPGVFVGENFFTAEECRLLAASAEPFLENTNPRNKRPARGYAFRNNDRFLVNSPGFAQQLFEKRLQHITKDILPGRPPVGVNHDDKFYRYTKGAAFRPHIDERVAGGPGVASEFTMLMCLQADNLRGGCTTFHTRPTHSVERRPGRVLLHWTGRDCLHSGDLVESGTKALLRTDLYFSTA